METRDVERLAKLTKEVVELGVTLALVPVKMVLRHLMPASTPMDQQRWGPADDGASVGDVTISTSAPQPNGASVAPPPPPPAPAPPPPPVPATPPSPHVSDLTS